IPHDVETSNPRTRPLLDRTWRWTPTVPIALFLEVRARHERFSEVLPIPDDGRHREPFIPIRLLVIVVVLRNRGLVAIRHAILPQVPGSQVCRRDLEGAAAGANAR